MTLLAPVTLPRQSNPGRHGFDGATRLINCACEHAGEEGRARFPIYAAPGTDEWLALTAEGVVRAWIEVDGALYVVAGVSLCKIAVDGTFSVLDTVGGADVSKLCTMARNRKATPQIGIVVDNFFYIVESDVVTEVTDVDLEPDINSIVCHDGYFVLLCDSGKFQITSIDEGTTIDALDFSTASADADKGTRVAVRNRDLILMGPESIEFWQDTGGTFPYERTTSSVGKHSGLLAADSVAQIEETIAFVATDKTVRMLEGYSMRRISTHAVERSIAADTSPETITALSWSYEGHVYYQISGESFTWIYDHTLGTWTEAKSYGLERSRLKRYISFNGWHLFSDYATGRIFKRSRSYYEEADYPIVWEIHVAAIHDHPNILKHNALYLDVMTGEQPVPGEEHFIMLDWSDDGGKTWSTQRLLSLGTQGQRNVSVKTFRLGKSKEQGRVYRLSGSAAAAACVLGIRPEVEGLLVDGG